MTDTSNRKMEVMSSLRSLSDRTRQANQYYCFCIDCDDGDNDMNHVSKFVRLGCTCISHYHCLIQYIRYTLGDRISMSLNGISCPYGSECKSFKTLDEVDGDDTKIYYITTTDLDNIVDYCTNHPKLQQYLDEHEYTALTHEEVEALRIWIEEERHKLVKMFTDEDYDLFIISTTKACPHCGVRSSHPHGHQCHHISPSRPPKRGGCPNCHVNYCYRCLSTEIENKRDRGRDSYCRCGYWSNFCRPITSSSDIRNYIAINDGGIPYDTRCGCVICSDCRYLKSCEYCPGDCCVCKGYVIPSPNEVIDTNNEGKKWNADGPALMDSSDMSLWDCCRHGNDDALRQLLDSGLVTTTKINKQDGFRRTALYLACDANHIECIRLLLSHDGIDVNIADNHGETPLHIACERADTRGYADIVSLLLSNGNGIDVNRANSSDRTPLHIACIGGHADIVSLLLSNGNSIDVNRANSSDTPLHIACIGGHTDIVSLLLSNGNGIDVNRANNKGDTPLHIACRGLRTDIVSLLLSNGNGIDVNKADSSGRTPLYIVRHLHYQKKRRRDIIKLLKEKGVKK